MNAEIEDLAVCEIRRQVGNWLARKDWEPEQLIAWLQGVGLPSSNLDQEPYVWLLTGLPLADERYLAETEMAARAARLLEAQPDNQPSNDERDLWLYNLLMLCAGLSCPTQLADQLHAMFLRRKLPPGTTSELESLERICLVQALESSLITNQRDARMRDVWLSMIGDGAHEYLTGDEYAGLEGIRLMPASETPRGTPALDDIGNALAMMAHNIEQRRDRRFEFHHLIERMIRTYAGRPTWEVDLVRQAHLNSWPDWAVSCLPRMFIPLPSSGALRTVVLWEVYLIILRASGVDFDVEEWLCQDSILKRETSPKVSNLPGQREFPIKKQMARITVSESAFNFLEGIAYRIESSRLVKQALMFDTYKKVMAVVIDELSFLEEELRLRLVNGYGNFTPESIKLARDTLRGEGLRVMLQTAAA